MLRGPRDYHLVALRSRFLLREVEVGLLDGGKIGY